MRFGERGMWRYPAFFARALNSTVCNQGVMGGAELLNVADEQSAENCAPDRR